MPDSNAAKPASSPKNAPAGRGQNFPGNAVRWNLFLLAIVVVIEGVLKIKRARDRCPSTCATEKSPDANFIFESAFF